MQYDRDSLKPGLWGVVGFVVGTGFGAALMFLLDPQTGRSRRGLWVDRTRHARSKGYEALGDKVSDLGNRTRGLAAKLRARLQADLADDRTLEERVRARLGRIATNPAAIAVTAEASRVTLRGSVPPEELDDVLDEVAAVRGVNEVHNLLQMHVAAPLSPGSH